MEGARRAASRRGRRPENSRATLFQELNAIYKQATGRPGKISTTSGSLITEAGLPTGPFFKFILAAVKPVPGLNTLRELALAKAVKRAQGQN